VSARDGIAARLTRGGYPKATQREADDRRAAWFASYISTILQRDVRDLARVDALHSLPNLLGNDARRLSEYRPLLGRLLESFVVGELRK
jgi:uncharacterized protein